MDSNILTRPVLNEVGVDCSKNNEEGIFSGVGASVLVATAALAEARQYRNGKRYLR